MPKKKAVSLVTNGYKNGLEEAVAEQLVRAKVPVRYETETLKYDVPEKHSKWTPDFLLPNGIVVETIGRFTTADRQKMRLLQAQHPDLDIRFVFNYSRGRISKKSATTYAMWCVKYGFTFADKSIPDAWLAEPKGASYDYIKSAPGIKLKK